MDIRKLLERDHREVMLDFQALGRADYQDENTLEKVILELESHAEVEEEVFYPAIQSKAKGLVKQAREGHERVKDLIARIRATEPERRANLCQELEVAVGKHVQEEENEIFPIAAKVLGQTRLDELGEEGKEIKEHILGPIEEIEEEERVAGVEEEIVEVTGDDLRAAAREIEHEPHPEAEEPAPRP